MTQRIMAFDPGGTTGIALRHDWALYNIDVSQSQPEHHHAWLYGVVNYQRPEVVVCESWVNTGDPAAELISIEYIGVLRLWCIQNGVQFVEQTNSTGKHFWTDDKLQRLGMYKASTPHGMDALRHLLYYVTFTLKDEYYLRLLRTPSTG